MADFKEVCVDIVQGEPYCTTTVTIQKYINETYKLKEQHPTLVEVLTVNEDGSIVARFPENWFRFPKPSRGGRKFTEEEKQANGDRLREYHRKKKEEALNE